MKLSCEFYGYLVCPIFLTLLASVVAAKDITDLPYAWGSSWAQIDTPKTHSRGSNAVLLLVKQKAVGPYYRNMFTSGCTVKNSEELRIIYVGITRPRELLVLGVPNGQDYEAWNSKLLN